MGIGFADYDYIVTIFDDRLDRNLEVCANLDTQAEYELLDDAIFVDADPVFCDYTVYDPETESTYDMPHFMKAAVEPILQNLYWDRLDNGTV